MQNEKYGILRRILALLSLAALLLTGTALTSCTPSGGDPQPDSATEAHGTAAQTEPGTQADVETGSDPVTEPPVDSSSQAGPETRDFPTELTVKEENGAASVTTADGLSYVISGYDSFSRGRFNISKRVTVTFAEGQFADAFTRMRFAYVSTEPLRLFVTYRQNGVTKTDDFYAEAGTNLFCGLISDFMKDKQASDITSVEFETCTGRPGQFALCGLDTQVFSVKLASQNIYYVETERYRLGLSAKWGWTICYLSDVKCEIPKVTNLVNMHDSGRLIQQSYYGTTVAQGDFVPGKINNAAWPYNPVQAGDNANNGSRLIDLVVRDTSVYVKVQPMDWGQRDWFCPAYMENTYTVDGDFIRVDNRYVEFSNYDNPYAGQELPAFYVIGYLNEFFWYDGDKSWTGAPLSSETDLEMIWTATEHTGNFAVPVKVGNTETWCAMYSSADNYGVGLYVPNVDQLSSMTYESADPSKNAKGTPCAYMMAAREIKLVSYDPLEYSYLITCGSIDEIRATFTANKDFAANAGLDRNSVDRRVPGGSMDPREIDGTDPSHAAFFTMGHAGCRAEFDDDEQGIRLSATVEDPYFHLLFTSVDEQPLAEDYKGIEITYRIPAETSARVHDGFQIFLVCGDDKEAQGGKSVDGTYIADGKYHTLFIDFSSKSFWQGKINMLRYDFLNQITPGDSVVIRSIRLVPAD